MEVEFLSPADVHHNVEEQELASGQGADHDAPGAEADCHELVKANLVGDTRQTSEDRPLSTSTGLVNLTRQRASLRIRYLQR